MFGYSLSGGLDVDSNGYADMTISDLSGSHVTTFRSSPIVTVIMDFQELKTQLDIVGDTDRLCPLTLSGDLNLICFNVTPCFHHESDQVNQFGKYVELSKENIHLSGVFRGVWQVSGNPLPEGNSI